MMIVAILWGGCLETMENEENAKTKLTSHWKMHTWLHSAMYAQTKKQKKQSMMQIQGHSIKDVKQN